MTLRLAMVTADTTDPTTLASWWAEQLGAKVTDDHGGTFAMVRGGGLPVVLAFQQVDAVTPGKNRLHLDLMSPDVQAEVERLLSAGASLVGRRGDESFAWVTLADPDGNEFCVAPGQ